VKKDEVSNNMKTKIDMQFNFQIFKLFNCSYKSLQCFINLLIDFLAVWGILIDFFGV